MLVVGAKKESSSWESIYMTNKGVKRQYIFVESIPDKVRNQYQIPSPDQIRDSDFGKQIDLASQRAQAIATLKQIIDVEFTNFNIDEVSGLASQFIGYVHQGYEINEAKLLSRTFGLLRICLRCKESHSIEHIYYALSELISENKDNNKYAILYKVPALRTFYAHMNKAASYRAEDIDRVMIHTV